MSFFSIIIPTYNRAHHLPKAIDSVLEQTFTDWELIIVDDGSTDNTKEIVESYDDIRIRYIYQENAERSAARNNGINHSKGEWICFLDSDDYYLSNHLEVFSSFITSTNVQSAFLISGGYDEKEGRLLKKPLFERSMGVHLAKFILEKTTITPISVCIHKTCFEQHKFIEEFKKSYWEDTHLWIRLAIAFPFYQLNDFTNVLAEHKGRSVNSKLSIARVNDHIGMINHLFSEYDLIMKKVFTDIDRKTYIDRKYRMFLYITRQNKQFLNALIIWSKGIINKPSCYLFSELPKIFINQIGIGIHGE